MSTQKELFGKIKIIIPAGGAMPGNPLAPALGQKQVNIKKFCDEFNPVSLKKYTKGVPLRTEILSFKDKTFSFEILGVSTVSLIKEYGNIKSGSKTAGRDNSQTISLETVEKIAKIKIEKEEVNTTTLSSAINMVLGTLKSMGIRVLK